MNYYERHLGDYSKDTAHLSMLEHGAYTLLLDRYYSTEQPIPADQAHRVARARSREEKAAVDVVLDEFFVLENGLWINQRAEEEIIKATARIEAAKENGKKGGRPKKASKPTENETQQKPNGLFVGSENVTQQKAHQAPSTIHHTPDINPIQRGYSNDSTRAVGSGAVELSIAMRSAGIESQPADPRLIALAQQGVAPETVTAACEEAKRCKPNERVGPAYVIAIVERWAAEAAQLRANGATAPAARASPPHRQTAQDRAQALADRLNRKTRDHEPASPDIIDINARPAGAGG